MNEKLFTQQEVAEIFNISTKSVRRYIQNGELEAYRIGPRLIRIPERAIKAFNAQSAAEFTPAVWDLA